MVRNTMSRNDIAARVLSALATLARVKGHRAPKQKAQPAGKLHRPGKNLHGGD